MRLSSFPWVRGRGPAPNTYRGSRPGSLRSEGVRRLPALETRSCPRAGPVKAVGAERRGALQLGTGSGEGQDARNDRRVGWWERDGSSNQQSGFPRLRPSACRGRAPGVRQVSARCGLLHQRVPVRRWVRPVPSLSRSQERVHVEGLLSLEHEVDGPTEAVGEDGERLALTVLALQALLVLHPLGVGAQEEDGGFGEGPLEVGVADLAGAVAGALAGGLVGAPDETGVGAEVLDSLEAVDGLDLVEDDQGEGRSDPRDGAQESQGLRVMAAGRALDVPAETFQEAAEVIDELDVHLDGALDLGVREALGDPLAVHFLGDLLAERREVVLGVGVLDVGEEVGAAADEVGSPAQEVPGGSHLGGVDVGHGEGAAPQEGGDLVGVDLVVLDLGAVDGLHGEGVAQDELDPLAPAEVGDPVPGEDALDADDQVGSAGGDGLEERVGRGATVLVKHDLAVTGEDAEVHGASVQVDPAVRGPAGRCRISWRPPFWSVVTASLTPVSYKGGLRESGAWQPPGARRCACACYDPEVRPRLKRNVGRLESGGSRDVYVC